LRHWRRREEEEEEEEDEEERRRRWRRRMRGRMSSFVRFATYEHNHCVMTITIAS
jgi:hypothetical protein